MYLLKNLRKLGVNYDFLIKNDWSRYSSKFRCRAIFLTIPAVPDHRGDGTFSSFEEP